MNTQFDMDGIRYIPGRKVRYCGTLGRFWTRWKYRQGCWVHEGMTFHPDRTTRRDIAMQVMA